jgi:ribosomal protein L11 methyltransferase
MDNYIQITIELKDQNLSDVIIAQLSDLGFEGFEEQENLLNAFISESNFDELAFKQLIESHNLSFTQNIIAPKNWNEEWEKSFDPVVIEDFCSIRASFHQPIKTTKYEIVITPKMSFGTGHHPTTYLMVKAISTIDFNKKSVIDFGTGTGVLAILSELSGAKNVVAIDNDEWSINNAGENIQSNNCTKILLYQAASIDKEKKADIVLANINKNIILKHFSSLKQHLESDGVLILSGLLISDLVDIESAAKNQHLEIISKFEKDGWLSLVLKAFL